MRFALGTAQFGMAYGIANQFGQIKPSEARRILKVALDNGVDTLDTAIGYGESEICLGQLGIQDFKVITKIPEIPLGCENITKWVDEQITASMNRLGIKSLYGLLLHRPHDLLSVNGKLLKEALLKLKDSGKVKKLGLSIYSPYELDDIEHFFNIDIVQAPFNVLDQRLYSSGWLDRLKASDIEVHSRSVFLQGLLLMKPIDRPSKFSRWASFWSKWDTWITQSGLTPLAACLQFPRSFPQISKIIVGVDSANQLEEILLASEVSSLNMPLWHDDIDSDLLIPSNWDRLS